MQTFRNITFENNKETAEIDQKVNEEEKVKTTIEDSCSFILAP